MPGQTGVGACGGWRVMAVVDIKKIPPGVRCQSPDCPSPATVEVFDDLNIARGAYCGKHGQAWLREQRERARKGDG